MEDFKWFEPKAKKSGNDVTIKIGTTKQGDMAYFTFRNGMYSLVSETEYLRIAVANNRVYFGQTDNNHGYKLTKQPSVKADNRYFSIAETEYVNRLRIYAGDFDLRFDKDRNLYYIEKE